MKYQLSEDYIKKRKRGMLIAVFIFGAVAVFLSILGVAIKKYEMFVGLIFLVMAWQYYKGMKTWVANVGNLRLGFDGQSLVFSGSDFETKMTLTSVKKVVVQTRKNQPISVLLFHASGSLEKLKASTICSLSWAVSKVSLVILRLNMRVSSTANKARVFLQSSKLLVLRIETPTTV